MHPRLPSFLLRIGLAIVFGYAATASFLDPIAWQGYFPRFLRELIPANILLTTFSIYEILLALWLLSGKYTYYAAILASITMAAIVLPNLNQLDVIFRDIAILFAALALAMLHRESRVSKL